MAHGDTEQQKMQQRIALGYRRIARQIEIIQALRSQGYPTAGAERQLANLKHRQQLHKARLARLQSN
jgi:hypothetical protein